MAISVELLTHSFSFASVNEALISVVASPSLANGCWTPRHTEDKVPDLLLWNRFPLLPQSGFQVPKRLNGWLTGPNTAAEHIPYVLNEICIWATRLPLQSTDSNFVEETYGCPGLHADAYYPVLEEFCTDKPGK